MRIDLGAIAAGESPTAQASKLVRNPELWSAEYPNLYTLVLNLYDKSSGKLFESISQQLGFREIEFTRTEVDENYNRITTAYEPITINGQPLLFRGTNRHDTDPFGGKYVPKEVYEEDVKLMKEWNLNAIRTSHYSNDEYLYYLCDKYGPVSYTHREGHWGIELVFVEHVVDDSLRLRRHSHICPERDPALGSFAAVDQQFFHRSVFVGLQIVIETGFYIEHILVDVVTHLLGFRFVSVSYTHLNGAVLQTCWPT